MRRSLRTHAAAASFLLILACGRTLAVEAPLSRASFERALEEGRTCRRTADAGPYVAFRKGAEPLLATVVDNLIQSYTADAITQSFVTVRLTTPYTRVRTRACQAKLLGGPLDEDELWNTARSASTISLWVETRTQSTDNHLPASEYPAGVPPTDTGPGPRVESVALRRGNAPDAPVVAAVSGGGGVEYDFPATALQGDGPFFALVHTEDPRDDLVLKLRRSVLRDP